MNQDHLRPPFRAALVQFKPSKGQVKDNVGRVRSYVEQWAADADVVVFPEACLSGYFLEGGVAEAAIQLDRLTEWLGASPRNGPDVVVGFYERWNRRLYNSVAYLEPVGGGWDVRHVHRKMFLPTYGVFDEARFVEPGTAIRAFDTRFGRMGMLICEDAWHTLPATILSLGGAEVILIVSASPARDFTPSAGRRPSNLETWERLAPAIASEHGVFVAVSQLAGSEGGKLFPGGSIAIAPGGRVIARGPLLEEAVTVASFDASAIDRSRAATPLLSDLERMLPHLERSLHLATDYRRDRDDAEEGASDDQEAPIPTLAGRGAAARDEPSLRDSALLELDLDLVERTLIEFIREEVQRRRGFERVVVGVSGGVDSAVSLFLACKALGADKVHGFRLPYRTSSPDSLDHAHAVLVATGAHEHTIEISAPIDRYVEEYEQDVTPLRKGNLMARLRAVVLFDQSAKLGALPLGTGNKSERLLGYFTWHADDSPPINPIGDLFKTQVWALARQLGIPPEIIDKPATADLVRGVTDADELGISYQDADPILHALVRGYGVEELIRMGFEANAVDIVWRRLKSTHWKRELPTVAVLSSTAIGEFYLRPVDY